MSANLAEIGSPLVAVDKEDARELSQRLLMTAVGQLSTKKFAALKRNYGGKDA